MITLVVYSRNRACQLDLLLQSITQYYDFFKVYIIYKCDKPFEGGYKKVKKTYENNRFITFIKEFDIKKHTLAVVRNANDFVGFAMDDSFFYRPVYLTAEDIDDLFFTHKIGCLSLRLGYNITREGPHELRFSPDLTYKKFFIWDFSRWGNSYFGYPFSLDGHIFKKEFLLECLDKIEWGIPNVIESQLVTKCNGAIQPPLMACPHKSILVTCPVNRVQDIFPNKYGESYPASPEFLNQMYVEGNRLELNALSRATRNTICSCHQEIEF